MPFIYILSMTAFALLCRVELVQQRLYGPQSIKYSLSGALQKRLPSPGIKKEKKTLTSSFLKRHFFLFFPILYLLVEKVLHYFNLCSLKIIFFLTRA